VIIMGELDDADRGRLESAVARVRALEVRLGTGGVILMAATDRARSARTYQRRKLGYRRASMDLHEAEFIRAMLLSGWYPRPKSGAPTFEGATLAAERMLLRFIGTTLTCETQVFQTGEVVAKVVSNHEATENVEPNAQD
jgi:hypothetical protein